MAELAGKRPSRASVKLRQREVRQCLAEFGLVQGPLRIWRGPQPDVAEQSHARRLRVALSKLGPVFAAFGAYLLSRPDLLPDGYDRELAALSQDGTATPFVLVQELIARELGCAPADAFTAFEEKPFAVGLLYQTHRAALPDRQLVTVKVAHPDREEEVATDVAALSLLRDVFIGEERTGLPLDSAIADFRYAVHQQINFGHQARALEAAARDADEFDLLRVAQVHKDRSTARLLTLESLPGWSLAQMLPSSGGQRWKTSAATNGRGGFSELDRRDLASNLCTVWLRQALLGRFFPAEVGVQDILVLPDNQLAFTGVFSSLPSALKKDLWDYLLAVSVSDPDNACTPFFRLVEKDPRLVHEDELRHRFRQAVPFRENGPDHRGEGKSLAELLLVYWRLAQAQGCRTPLHLTRFLRALFLVNDAALRLAPRQDSLRDGLENVRAMAAVEQVRELMSLRQLNQSLERYAPVLLELPKKMNDVLTLLAEGSARMHLQMRETAEKRGHKNSTAMAAALLLTLAGVVLLVHHLALGESLGSWGVKVGAVLVVLMGVLLLGKLSSVR
jgi:ubiquinone biosynthesis protein